MTPWKQRGLRFKLSLGISLTLLIILGISFWGAANYITAQLWQRETQTARNLNAITATLLEDAMMAGHKDNIQEAIETMGKSVGGHIDSIAVYDDQSVLTSFATGFPGGRAVSYESLAIEVSDPGCWDCHRFPPSERPAMTVVNVEGKDVIRNVVPLYNKQRCQTCHGTGQSVLGDSIVDLRLDQYQQAVTTVIAGLGLGIAAAIFLVGFVLFRLLRRIVLSPMGELINGTQAIVSGNLNHVVLLNTQDEVGQLSSAFNIMTERLRDLVSSLEQRVEERTRDLAQRTAYLEASAEVSQRASSVLDPRVLIQQIVDLIRDRFDLYYVGLFMVDEKREWANLVAGTGEAGQLMLQRNHRLKVGEGMIGWSIANSQARIAQDVGEDAVRFNNPHLPETRTEAALPLRSRGRVLGAISVQSLVPAAFNQDTITVLQTMSDQVATALDNAQLFAASQAALEAERRAYGELSREAWQEHLRSQKDLGIISSSVGELSLSPKEWTPEMKEAGKTGKIVKAGKGTIAVPIILRDQALGVVRLRKNEGEGDWSGEEIGLIETLVDQLELAVESARLYTDTQKMAARERLVTEITTKIRATTDPQVMLQTAITELRQALSVKQAQVILDIEGQER